MKKSLASGVGIAAALVAFFGSGSAGAINEYVGMTYEKAAASISNWGTPVIASREGSYLPTDQCMVVGSKMASFLDSSGNKQGGKVLLDINCNDTTALDGHPGNSVVTPAGQDALKWRQRAKELSADYEKATAAGKTPACAKGPDYVEWCTKVCKLSGTCSADLAESLGL